MANKTVLITGAALRLGAALARDLHARGMDIIIHYNRSHEQALALADELNAARSDSACVIMANLLDESGLARLVETAYGFRNRLDVLINNASVFYPTSVSLTSNSQWDELIGVNMKAPYFLSCEASAYLRQHRGCIVNITDIHADRPLQGHAVYSASKAGLAMLTRALARELGPDVRVNAVAPGAILWPQDMPARTMQKILSRTVLKQQGKTTDITSAVYYLIEDARYMTGQVLTLDGGRTLYS
jgi:pteridine reductase